MNSSLSATFKRKFIAGLFVSIPAIITILVIGKFFTFVDSLLEPFYSRMLGYYTPGMGFVSAIILIFLIGIISTNVFGKKVIKGLENIFLKLPVFKGFYTAVKQLVDAFSPESKTTSFKRFVIIEYPRKGIYAFGFLTKESTVMTCQNSAELCLRAVYVPTNNLYLGEIVLVSEDNVFYTEIPIDEGIKIILSGGIAAPNMIKEVRE
ncbi:MAG: hypothetical protein CVV37_00485 [Nitrospira bacterium HGW-Nitrospira-1]|nr:MAG: hypothetical protein CVV37_00485 [Nitrospira bacterium HGW-Nitrospira-1]